jgi:meso-butanediol dehydrogenase/(S,S)-butanediol dehydrogenase/diacetyl reductase
MQSWLDFRVLVTGSGSGIGRATALRFAAGGASKVYLTGRREEMLQETATLIAEESPNCVVVTCPGDITDAGIRSALVERIGNDGRLDILVNNAGVYSTAKFPDTSEEEYRRIMSLNVDAVFSLTRDLLPVLERSARPAVVNIGSTLSLRPIPQGTVYNMAKAAVDHFTRSLAGELGPRGIRVNCVSPGITETEMYRGRYATDQEYHAAIREASGWHPLGRVGTPEDIAEAVWFLASPASSWITGVVLPVDGGLLCT